MSALTTISRQGSRLAGLPATRVLIGIPALIAALAIGMAVQAGIPWQAAEQPVFNAVEFRAGERVPLTFDSVGFRAGEREQITAPEFDAVTFRAGEKSLR